MWLSFACDLTFDLDTQVRLERQKHRKIRRPPMGPFFGSEFPRFLPISPIFIFFARVAQLMPQTVSRMAELRAM